MKIIFSIRLLTSVVDFIFSGTKKSSKQQIIEQYGKLLVDSQIYIYI